MEIKSKRDEVIELVNKLFIYTDDQSWDKLENDVFMPEVYLDMSSMGAPPAKLAAREICAQWKSGFADLDAIHHQSGNYLVNFSDDVYADIFCYAIATHYKASATEGPTRTFTGNYNIRAVLTDQGWRLSHFTYVLKYITGNAALR